MFKRLKNELNDELLNFAIAKVDSIESLGKYQGRSEPCFLFFGGGTLVCVVRGANPPELERCIREKLTQEHEILSGELERIEIKDPYLVALEEAEAEEIRRKEEEEGDETYFNFDIFLTEVTQEITFVILKPDVILSEKQEELIFELISL
ncbi:unnamed protein product [Protopolystoma xenopodis]|uniref:Uncharacterized protein n=1 Tax=Protopolystoma xenopodis TaxID=117903 RepID=A0A3S5BNQ7_9PLAT|nr:unnamed protein product [Protopolystoma xenopodis]